MKKPKVSDIFACSTELKVKVLLLCGLGWQNIRKYQRMRRLILPFHHHPIYSLQLSFLAFDSILHIHYSSIHKIVKPISLIQTDAETTCIIQHANNVTQASQHHTYMYIYKEFRRLFHLLVNISFEFSYEYVEITIMLTLIYKSERLDLLFWLHFSVCAECSWTLLLWFRINFPFNRTRYHHIIVTPSPK